MPSKAQRSQKCISRKLFIKTKMNPGLIGGIIGSILGVIGGGLGTYCSIKNTNGLKENSFL